MKGLIVILSILACTTVFAATHHADPNAPRPVSVAASLDIKNTVDETITVKKSQPMFSIKLPSNRTTGYSWFVRKYDDQFITPVDHTYSSPSNGKPGQGGQEMWTFKVKQAAFAVPTITDITMLYAQPWNINSDTTVKHFKIVTQVK